MVSANALGYFVGLVLCALGVLVSNALVIVVGLVYTVVWGLAWLREERS